MAEVISLSDFRAAQKDAAVVAKPVEPIEVKPAAPANMQVSEDITHTLNGKELFNYSPLMQQAMLGIVKAIMTEVAAHGLPKDSVLFMAFSTTHPAVEMSPRLRRSHPTEMTVMFDQWWEDLVVTDNAISVTLNFGDIRENLVIPFVALTGFQDAGSGFGVRFGRVSTDDTTPPPNAA